MMAEATDRERVFAALSVEEQKRGRRLMLHSDALNHAYLAVEAQEWDYGERKTEILAAINEMRREANAAWDRFNKEHNLPD